MQNSQLERWKEQSAHRQIKTKLAPPSPQQQRRRRNSSRRGSPATSIQRDGGGKACLSFNTPDTSRRLHEAPAAATKTPLTPRTQSRSGSY